eukprot:7259416-Pyramimonas_sp.AAC.1
MSWSNGPLLDGARLVLGGRCLEGTLNGTDLLCGPTVPFPFGLRLKISHRSIDRIRSAAPARATKK